MLDRGARFAMTVTTIEAGAAKSVRAELDDTLELSIVLPCLDESETLAAVIDRAQRFLMAYNISGEIIVADNGSTDGSPALAIAGGAKVVHVPQRGYGAALIAGIKAARGRYVAMGDADQSYDFMGLMPFVERLRDGSDLVMGNRFLGGIGRGAMPALHRYLGNPVLSFAGRLLFNAPVGDFHCGLRAFRRASILALDLNATGMEFASEMVVKSQLRGLRIEEVPTTLHKDGRSRPPHLRSWRDGWRHLKFLLTFSPRWLYIYPGTALTVLSLVAFSYLLPGYQILGSARLGIHSLMFAAFGILVGVQLSSFGLIASIFGVRESYWFTNGRLDPVKRWLTIDRGCAIGGTLVVCGIAGLATAFLTWAGTGYGDLNAEQQMRTVIPSVLLAVVGIQIAFTCFMVELLGHSPVNRGA
jgi:glycosyltransferase involved in cell wall biosynthesis